jgi:hypothetical protein
VPDSQFHDLFEAKYLMNHACAIPQNHISSRLLDKPGTEVLVRGKNNRLVRWNTFHDICSVATGANNVAQGLYSCRAVDVRNYNVIGIFLLEFFKQSRGSGIGQGAARVQIGQ